MLSVAVCVALLLLPDTRGQDGATATTEGPLTRTTIEESLTRAIMEDIHISPATVSPGGHPTNVSMETDSVGAAGNAKARNTSRVFTATNESSTEGSIVEPSVTAHPGGVSSSDTEVTPTRQNVQLKSSTSSNSSALELRTAESVASAPEVVPAETAHVTPQSSDGFSSSDMAVRNLSTTDSGHASQTAGIPRFFTHSTSLSLDLASITTAVVSAPLYATAAPTAPLPDHFNSTAASDGVLVATAAPADVITDSPIEASPDTLTKVPGDDVWGNVTQLGPPPGEKDSLLSDGTIAGIVLGCLAAVVAFGLLMLCFCYKQRRKVQLSPKKTGHYTGLFDDSITLSYINCQFEPTKDPMDELTSLDTDAYLNSLEQFVTVQQRWPPAARTDTASTQL